MTDREKSERICYLQGIIREHEKEIQTLREDLEHSFPSDNFSIFDMPGEIWKDIENYEGLYQISNKGRVKSLSRRVERMRVGKDFSYQSQEKIRKPLKDGCGYLFVDLQLENRFKNEKIHKLVALNFIGIPEGKKEVNHKNGVKRDNRVENLEWVTRSENLSHAIRTGLRLNKFSGLGSKNPKSKPVLQYTMGGDFIREFSGQQEAWRETGIHQATISANCRGKIKHAGGFVWKYGEGYGAGKEGIQYNAEAEKRHQADKAYETETGIKYHR